MGFSDADVAAVRGATDVVALIGEHVALRRQGRQWSGRCPFHGERTASFYVNAELGVYHCFGCQASGDAITFVRNVEGLGFVEAVERLAERAGIQLAREDQAAAAGRRRRGRLLEAMEAAVEWYHARLLSGPDAGPARQYLRSRGYGSETVRAFRLGWAPDDWDALCRALHLPAEVLRDTGLGFVNRRGRQQDGLRARVVFPIFDPSGKAIALGGRVLPGAAGDGAGGDRAGGPKYKNSPDTPIYSKRRTLYGLNWAKAAVVETGEVVVCEGYTDVIALFQAGVPRAVATCGTALAEEHFRLLRNFAGRVVLAYDADRAGQAAAERFYAWERRHELDIAVADLPAGADPADLGRRDPEALRAAVAGARPFLAFQVERIFAGADLRSPEGRARAAEAAMAVVAQHPSALVRDQYVMVVADRCRVEPGRLRGMAERTAGHAARARGGGTPSATGGGIAAASGAQNPGGGPPPGGPELEALRLAVQRPGDVAERLRAVLFADPLCREAFRALAGARTLHEAMDGAAPEVADLLARLAVEQSDAEPEDVVGRLVRAAGERAVASLEAEARASEGRFEDLAALIGWLRLRMEELADPETAVQAVEWLLAWLAEWAQEE